jgi:membrane protein required for colicin V production
MTETLTAFDAAAITLIIISAIMALSRGFVRELATLGAFIAALAAAYYGHRYLRDPVAAGLPGNLPDWMADLLVIVLAFVLVYAVVTWFGHRLSRNIQGTEGIGLIDRLAGLVFGVARGAVAIVFFVYLLQLGVEEERIPPWIAEARTYAYFETAADYLHENAPRIVQEAGAFQGDGVGDER